MTVGTKARAPLGDRRYAVNRKQLAGRVADLVCQMVAELPDRTSPEDWPDAMLVTAQELHLIVVASLATIGLERSA